MLRAGGRGILETGGCISKISIVRSPRVRVDIGQRQLAATFLGHGQPFVLLVLGLGASHRVLGRHPDPSAYGPLVHIPSSASFPT